MPNPNMHIKKHIITRTLIVFWISSEGVVISVSLTHLVMNIANEKHNIGNKLHNRI